MNTLIPMILSSALLVGCGDIETMQPPTDLPARRDEPPAPPPGDHDESFIKLPRPLSVPNAKRVLSEARVFAPWGIGYGGRPIQALALNVVLQQPTSREILNDIYRQSSQPGQLLALCGCQTADPERFTSLSDQLANDQTEIVAYWGDCSPDYTTVSNIISKLRNTTICRDIPKSRKKIAAMCERAG